MTVRKNSFSIGDNELFTKTSADMVTYGNGTVADVLDEITGGGSGAFLPKLLQANSAADVRRLLNLYPETIYDECGNHWDIKGNIDFVTVGGESAFNFDGETYLQHSGDFVIGAKNFTVSAKANFSNPDLDYNTNILCCYNTAGSGPAFHFGLTSDFDTRFWYKNSSGTNYDRNSTQTFSANTTYFLSYQYDFDNKMAYTYVNGSQVASGSVNNTANLKIFRIGCAYASTPSGFWQGPIFKLKISESLEICSSDSDFVKDDNTLSLIHFEDQPWKI